MENNIKKIGIYKITSPSLKIYIGQSIDIERRFKSYYNLNKSKKQTRLYNSFLKYGIINHKFEILEECNIEELNIKERYWQDYYNVLDEYGLNCRLTDTNDKKGKLSVKTCLKIKNKSSKRVLNVLTKKIYNSAKECAIVNNLKENTLRNKLTNKIINDTYYLYEFDIPMEGINYNCELITSKDKKVINIKTKEIYKSLTECCKLNKLTYSTLKRKLYGGRLNNTDFKYLKKEEFLIIKYSKLLEKAIEANKYSPFNIYDSEYIKELNKLIKIMSDKEKNYDDEPVVACRHCKSLHIEFDDTDNNVCIKCGSVNETKEFQNIYKYKEWLKIKE